MGILDSCKPNFKSRAMGKIDTDSVAWFTRIRKGSQCNIFGFRSASSSDGETSIQYSKKLSDKPTPQSCGLEQCDMTGTLFVTPVTSEDGLFATTVKTKIATNGEPFQYGYLSIFIYGNSGDSFDLALTDVSDQNANVYTVTLNETGWNEVVVEIFNPDSTLGNGWVGDGLGFYLVVTPKQSTEFRLNKIEFYENVYDMVRDSTIGFSCITDFSGDPTLTITEDTCAIPSYDDSATTIERSITATKMIGDHGQISPLFKRLDQSEFPVKRNGIFTAISKTYNGKTYAALEIPDMAQITCLGLVVQPQDCEFDVLSHLSIDGSSHDITVPEDMYFVEDQTIYLTDTYIGNKFVVAYPKMESGTAYQITTKDLNQYKYFMEMTTYIGNDEYLLKADNIFMTAIPFTWTREAGTLTIPYTMVRDDSQNFGVFVKLDKVK